MTARRGFAIAFGLAATFVLVLMSVPTSRARPDRLAVLAAVLFVGFAVRRRLGVGARPVAEAPPGSGYDAPPAEEQDVRLARLDASLTRAAESGEQFWRATRPMLRRLATERLRVRTGIDVTADPAGARRQMGEELWLMFSTPEDHLGPPPGPDGLRVLVERLERL